MVFLRLLVCVLLGLACKQVSGQLTYQNLEVVYDSAWTFKNLSLIPVLGLLSCMYLMTELGYTNWLRFLIWLAIGLIIYFTYSYKNSNLNEHRG